MTVSGTIAELHTRLKATRAQKSAGTIGLVPTMGALHRGHAALMARARAECDHVVVSIFVNPLQFDRSADLDDYPRRLETDLALCRNHGVDLVFAPSSVDMYQTPPTTRIDVGRLGHHLCGKHRSGHFDGVGLVALKLFNLVRPNMAYFGEKDAQQLAIVRRIVTDLSVPVRIVGVPTVRDPDGLALSSRNQHLSPAERALAPALHQALEAARGSIARGATDVAAIVAAGLRLVPQVAELRVEYLEVVDPVELQPVDVVSGTVLVAGAIWVGTTRLIDNVLCEPAGDTP